MSNRVLCASTSNVLAEMCIVQCQCSASRVVSVVGGGARSKQLQMEQNRAGINPARNVGVDVVIWGNYSF